MKEELVARYVDDRGSLSNLELQELVEVMEGDPALCRDLRALVCMDDLLSRTLCVERQNFRAQVAQRILDERQGEPARQERRKRLLVDVRLLKEDRNATEVQAIHRRRPSWPVFLPWAAAAAVVVAALGLWLVRQGARGEGAGLESVVAKAGTVTGAVSVRGADGTTRVPGVGAEIGPGDRVLTGTNGEVELTWKDGTRITARENSEFGFADCRVPDGGYRKALDLTRGGLAMSVAKQPAGSPATIATPNGRCTAIGTKFFLLVAQATNTFTRLDVTEGSVRFQSSAFPAPSSALEVSAGQAVSSGPNVPATVIRSFGRELSAKHGGVVYRDYGRVYDLHRGFAIDNVVLKPSGKPLVASCREFLDMLDARNRKGVRMEKRNVDNRDRDVLVFEGMNAVKQVSVCPEEDMRHWMARIDLVWKANGNDTGIVAPLVMPGIADPPAHGLPRARKFDGGIAGKDARFQIESRAMRIGETPAGAPIYEVETLCFGQRHMIAWSVGRFCFGARVSNGRLIVLDMRVEPLDVVSR